MLHEEFMSLKETGQRGSFLLPFVVCRTVLPDFYTTFPIHWHNEMEIVYVEEGEFFIADLVGLPVFLDTGEKLGVLDDIYNTGSSDIYVVKNELGKQFLLPYIDDVIKKIDLENSKIIVHLIEGLI